MITICLTEVFLITLLNKYLLSEYLLFSSSVNLFTMIFIPFWLIISYVFGRYSFQEELYKSRYLILFFKLFIRTFFIANLGIIFVFIFSININLNNYNHFDKTILLYSFFISCFINILQIPFIYYFVKNTHSQEKWIFLGPINIYYLLKNELKLSRKKIKIIFNLDDIKLILRSEIKGIFIYDFNQEKLNQILQYKIYGLKIYNLEKWCEYYLQKLPSEVLSSQSLISSNYIISEDAIQLRIKRVGDFLFSIFLILISSPIMFITAILIYLEDRNGFIYKQERVGKNQKKFMLYKLRTMIVNAEKGKPKWSNKTDSRITKVGKFLRRTRLDELPQLFNVLMGDMSLIGPRPEREVFDKELIKHIPFYNSRYFIRPGLSGWAQVNFSYGSSIEDSKNKFGYDIYYLRNFSIWLDFLILLKTIKIVILKRGSDPLR